MEGVSAAVVEFARSPSLDFPMPPFSEARANLTNTGHVIAHDIHFTISITLTGVSGTQQRTILSKSITVPALSPAVVINQPDFIYPFELSGEEHQQILNTNSYLAVDGDLSYENGFGDKLTRNFCYAYLWGGQKFGRWSGSCDLVQSQISLARRLEKQ